MNPIQALKGKSITKFVTNDSKNGELEWEIRPIPFTLLLEHFDKFTNLPQSEDGTLTPEQAKIMQQSLYPLIKAIIPKCIVTPKVTLEETADSLQLDDIPFDALIEIFNKIVELTGLDKKAEEARKKLQATKSPSQ